MIGTLAGTAGHPGPVKGYAQDFGFPVSAVQFSCDGGRTWTTYETPNAESGVNVNWSFTFTPPRSRRLPGCRARRARRRAHLARTGTRDAGYQLTIDQSPRKSPTRAGRAPS